jgi:hypothetical protein
LADAQELAPDPVAPPAPVETTAEPAPGPATVDRGVVVGVAVGVLAAIGLGWWLAG